MTQEELEAAVLALQQLVADLTAQVTVCREGIQQVSSDVGQNRAEVIAAIAVAQQLSNRLQAQTVKVDTVDQRLRDEADAIRARARQG